MEIQIEPTITKDYLLSKYPQETYMEYYLGIPVKKGLFKSPLRADDHPTCSFYVNKSGDVIFKDFKGDFYGNFISVVMRKYSCTYHMAMKIIANDFGLIKNPHIKRNPGKINENPKKFEESGPASIQIEMQEFSQKELSWWASYGITKDILKKFRVYSCKSVFLNGNYFASSSEQSPIYGYYKGEKDGLELWRIYFPKRKSYRFLSNWSAKMIQGLDQLPKKGKVLVITKSLKDVMTLYSCGLPAIAPNSENLFIPDVLFEKLKGSFDYICVLYDNDLAGLSNMNKIRKQFDIPCFWIPRKYEAKDISDYHKKYGRDKTIKLIQDAVNEYGRKTRRGTETKEEAYRSVCKEKG